MPHMSQYLRYERQRRGWSQTRVAHALGTSAEIVGRWERGVALPSPYFRERLCQLFDCDAVQLGFIPPASFALPQSLTRPVIDPALPPQLRGRYQLVGRNDWLVLMQHRLLATDQHPVVALSGLPGVGKSALVTELVHTDHIRQAFPAGILWAELGPQVQGLSVLSRWGQVLGMTATEQERITTLAEWQTRLRSVLAGRRMLIVLDDVWTFADGMACMVGGAGCVTLLTTRSPTLAAALAPDGTYALPELEPTASQALLEQWIPDLPVPAIVAPFVAAAGGLPLVLLVIGRYLHALQVTGYEQRLADLLELLRHPATWGGTDTSQFPSLAGLTATLAQSLALSLVTLTPAQQQTWYALGVLPAKPQSFPEAIALLIGECTVATLDTLVDIGLLDQRGPGRYSLHPVLADYARFQLHEQGHIAVIAMRWYTWLVAALPTTDPVILSTADPDLPVLLAGVDFLLTQGQPANGVDGVVRLYPLLGIRGLYPIAWSLLIRAYSLLPQLGADTGDLASTLYWHLGQVALKQGHYREAEHYLDEGTTSRPSDALTLKIVHEHGNVALAQGDLDAAERYYRAGLQRARTQCDSQEMGDHANNLGVVALKRGQQTVAHHWFIEAAAILRTTPHQDSYCAVLANLGVVAGMGGDLVHATTILQEGAQLARRLQHRPFLTNFLGNLAMVARLQADWLLAATTYREAIGLAQQMGYPAREGELLGNLAAVLLRQGDSDAATAAADAGLRIGERLAQGTVVSLCLGVLGEVAWTQQDMTAAADYFTQALARVREGEDYPLLVELLLMWGNFSMATQAYDVAVASYEEVRTTAAPFANPTWEAQAVFGLAQAAWAQGAWDQARVFGTESERLARASAPTMQATIRQWLHDHMSDS